MSCPSTFPHVLKLLMYTFPGQRMHASIFVDNKMGNREHSHPLEKNASITIHVTL